jgi:3-hydroxyisobutyrate dehydrogenase-like beta-hydroxyacid dehydrogenase
MEARPVREPDARERIAVIGLGRMGLPMAVSLARAGRAVVGYDQSPERDLPEAAWRGGHY